jgi:tetraacyldisaccharide 4'-kinase
VQIISFPDHHAFSEKDISQIEKIWSNILSTNKILFTTEKDAVRLQQVKIPETMAKHIYYVPIGYNVPEVENLIFKELSNSKSLKNSLCNSVSSPCNSV